MAKVSLVSDKTIRTFQQQQQQQKNIEEKTTGMAVSRLDSFSLSLFNERNNYARCEGVVAETWR